MIIYGTFTYVTRDTYHKACPNLVEWPMSHLDVNNCWNWRQNKGCKSDTSRRQRAIASVAPGLCLGALWNAPIENYEFLIEVPFTKENLSCSFKYEVSCLRMMYLKRREAAPKMFGTIWHDLLYSVNVFWHVGIYSWPLLLFCLSSESHSDYR